MQRKSPYIPTKKYLTKLELVNELEVYVKSGDTNSIDSFVKKLSDKVGHIDMDIQYLNDLKKDYNEIIQKINQPSGQTCHYVDFIYTGIDIVGGIKYEKTITDNNMYKYSIDMMSLTKKNQKKLDNTYSHILLPITILQQQKTLIIRYQHNQPTCDGDIIGTRC